MTHRSRYWLVCSSLTALAACLNPLPDDSPSRADDAPSAEPLVPGETRPEGSNAEGDGSDPSGGSEYLTDDADPAPVGSPVDNGSGARDAGAPDGGAVRTSEATTERHLAPDAGSGDCPQ